MDGTPSLTFAISETAEVMPEGNRRVDCRCQTPSGFLPSLFATSKSPTIASLLTIPGRSSRIVSPNESYRLCTDFKRRNQQMRLVLFTDGNNATTTALIRETVRLSKERDDLQLCGIVTSRPDAFRSRWARDVWRRVRRIGVAVANGGGPAEMIGRSRIDLTQVRRPELLTTAELCRRIRAFGAVDLEIAGATWPVTRVRPGRSGHLTFTSADGVRCTADRVRGLPVRLTRRPAQP